MGPFWTLAAWEFRAKVKKSFEEVPRYWDFAALMPHDRCFAMLMFILLVGLRYGPRFQKPPVMPVSAGTTLLLEMTNFSRYTPGLRSSQTYGRTLRWCRPRIGDLRARRGHCTLLSGRPEPVTCNFTARGMALPCTSYILLSKLWTAFDYQTVYWGAARSSAYRNLKPF